MMSGGFGKAILNSAIQTKLEIALIMLLKFSFLLLTNERGRFLFAVLLIFLHFFFEQ